MTNSINTIIEVNANLIIVTVVESVNYHQLSLDTVATEKVSPTCQRSYRERNGR